MQIIIDIPDKEYKEIIDNKLNKSWDMTHYERVIANGTPLPKGHGRILDEKDILYTIVLQLQIYQSSYISPFLSASIIASTPAIYSGISTP